MGGRTVLALWPYWNWRSGQKSVLFQKVFRKTRGPLLVLNIVEDPEVLENYLKSYFDQCGDKACCLEDLKPYIVLDDDRLQNWTSYLRQTPMGTVI